MSKMKLGYIGLGSMGGAIARRLLEQFSVLAFDTNPVAMDHMARVGGMVARDISQIAQECEVIFLCLPTSAHVRSVIFGPDGIAANARPGAIVIDQTTGNPNDTRQMAKELEGAGISVIDCPVSGGPRGAREGNIAFMVGATPEQFQRVEKILATVSPRVFHVGDVGAGHVVKIANNTMSHTQRLITLEVISLAVKNGIDPAVVADVIEASSGSNYYLRNYFRSRILAGNFAPTFTLELLNKDLRLASDLAADSQVPMPVSNLVRQIYLVATSLLGPTAQADQVSSFIDALAKTQVVGSGGTESNATAPERAAKTTKP